MFRIEMWQVQCSKAREAFWVDGVNNGIVSAKAPNSWHNLLPQDFYWSVSAGLNVLLLRAINTIL